MAKTKKSCPGSKIRSKGKGRGKGVGKGKGPIKKKKRFIKYWYSPEDPNILDRSAGHIQRGGQSFGQDMRQTSQNIRRAPETIGDKVFNAIQKAKKSTGYIKDTPKRWNKGLEERVERERQKTQEMNRPMSPEEYQKAVERYNEAFGINEEWPESPTPEHPPVNPEKEQDLYRNTRPTPPYMPENPPPVISEEQFMELPENQQLYYRKKKPKKQKHNREPFRYVKEMPKENSSNIKYLRKSKRKK